ncbi:MAG: FitA-like ribbon-helix-helix domain-containing protein [Armatimonadota bacterium]
MVSFTVRNIPEQLYQRFKQLAERNHLSLSDQVKMAIERLVQQDDIRVQQAEVLEQVRRHRGTFCPTDVGAPDSVELLREDREQR